MTLGEQVVAQLNPRNLEDWQRHLLELTYQQRIDRMKCWATNWHAAQVVESLELTQSFKARAAEYARELAAEFAPGSAGRAIWTVLANE